MLTFSDRKGIGWKLCIIESRCTNGVGFSGCKSSQLNMLEISNK